MGLIMAPTYAYFLKRENDRKDAEQEYENGLPEEKKRVYTVQELRDLGDKAPEFRYTI
jgi:hypothetical protein